MANERPFEDPAPPKPLDPKAAPNWSDPNTATPLQNFKAIKELGRQAARIDRHRARNTPSDN